MGKRRGREKAVRLLIQTKTTRGRRGGRKLLVVETNCFMDRVNEQQNKGASVNKYSTVQF